LNSKTNHPSGFPKIGIIPAEITIIIIIN
jgi:hypothetical protein